MSRIRNTAFSVAARHGLQLQDGGLPVAPRQEALRFQAQSGLRDEEVGGQLGHHLLIGDEGGAVLLQNGRLHEKLQEERKVGLQVQGDVVSVQHGEEVHKVGLNLED